MLAVIANYSLTNTMAVQSDAGFFLDEPVPQVVGKAAAGALYGGATGWVFAMLARRSEPDVARPPARPRPRLSRIAAGLAALLVLIVVGAWGAYASTTQCRDEVHAALEEFPQYGDREIEPYDTPEGRCSVRFYIAGPEGEIFAYYVENLPDVIPLRSDQGEDPRFDRGAYRKRNRVERLVGRLKRWRRVATRYEKRTSNYLVVLMLASIVLWL